MTNSGTYSFNLTKSQIIARAFQEINIYSLEDQIEANDYNFASDKLNTMLKTWETEGIRLWKRKEGILFPQYNVNNYQIGSVSGADNCCAFTGMVNTTLSSAGNSTTITVTSATGLSNNMFIGIQLNDKTRQWTTITNVSGTTITLNNTLTTTAASGNTVVAYTSKINRPLEIMRMTVLDLTSTNLVETRADYCSYDVYQNMPVKNTLGRPNQFYYARELNNSLPYTGTLYLFPTPDSVYRILKFTYYDGIQDCTAANETLDLPQEWTEGIILNLAAKLCRPYEKLTLLQAGLGEEALAAKENLKVWDSDIESLKFKLHR